MKPGEVSAGDWDEFLDGRGATSRGGIKRANTCNGVRKYHILLFLSGSFGT